MIIKSKAVIVILQEEGDKLKIDMETKWKQIDELDKGQLIRDGDAGLSS